MLTMLEDEKKHCQTLEQRLGYCTHRLGNLRDSTSDRELSTSQKYMPSQSLATNLAKSSKIGTKSKGCRNIVCSPNGRTNPAQQTLSARAWIAASTMSQTEASHLVRKQEIIQVPCCLHLGETRGEEDAADAEQTGAEEGCLQHSAEFFSQDDPIIATEEKKAILSGSSSMAHSLESPLSGSPIVNSVAKVNMSSTLKVLLVYHDYGSHVLTFEGSCEGERPSRISCQSGCTCSPQHQRS